MGGLGTRIAALAGVALGTLATANLALAQASVSWMDGWWEVRAEDRERGVVFGMARVATGSRGYVELYLPGPTTAQTQGPIRSTSLDLIERDGHERLAATFEAGTTPTVDRLDTLTLTPDTMVIPFDPADELEISISTGLNDLSARRTLGLRDTRVPDRLTIELAVPTGTSTQAARALDGVWKVSGAGVGYTRKGVLSQPLLGSPLEMGPETWVKRDPSIRATLARKYAPLDTGSQRITLKLLGALLPPTGGVDTVEFDAPGVTWANEYEQKSVREAEMTVTVRGDLSARAVPYSINGGELRGIWFPEPPGLMPVAGGFVRDFREDQQVSADIAVTGELLRLRATYAEPPMLNILNMIVAQEKTGAEQTFALYRDAADPAVYVSAPLLVEADEADAPDASRLAELGRFAFSQRPAVVLEGGGLGGDLVATPEQPAAAGNVDPVGVVRVVDRPPNLVSQAEFDARACIDTDGEHDAIGFEDHAALIAFRDALATRIRMQIADAPGATPAQAELDEAAAALVEAAWTGAATPLARVVIELPEAKASTGGMDASLIETLTLGMIVPDAEDFGDGPPIKVAAPEVTAGPRPAAFYLAPEALVADYGDGVTSEQIAARARAAASEALRHYRDALTQARDRLITLDPCEPEELLATLAPLAPEHGNVVGASMLRLKEATSPGPRWAPDRVLTARINSLPVLLADIDAQAAYTRQQVQTAAALASAAFGGGVFLARHAITSSLAAGVGWNAATYATAGGGLLFATDVVTTGMEAKAWYDADARADNLKQLYVYVPAEMMAAATRAEQDAMYETLLSAGFTALGIGAVADFAQAARQVLRVSDTPLRGAALSLKAEGEAMAEAATTLVRERGMSMLDAAAELEKAVGEGLHPRAVLAGLTVLDGVPMSARGLRWSPQVEADVMRYLVNFTGSATDARRVLNTYMREFREMPADLFFTLRTLGTASDELGRYMTRSRAPEAAVTLAVIMPCGWLPALMGAERREVVEAGGGGRVRTLNEGEGWSMELCENADIADARVLVPGLDSVFSALDVAAPEATRNIEFDTAEELEAETAGWQPIGEALIAEGLTGADMIAPRGLYYGNARDFAPAVARAARAVLRDEITLSEALDDEDARAFLVEVFGEDFVGQALEPAAARAESLAAAASGNP